MSHISPRAHRVLFVFLSANAYLVVSIVKFSQKFKNVSLTKPDVELFSEINPKQGYRQNSSLMRQGVNTQLIYVIKVLICKQNHY